MRAPSDQPARDRARDPSRSVHVEAPAGSGKTTLLMMRYLALLAQVREPEEILALTFTRKAAGELRTRIQQQFLGRGGPGALPGGDVESSEPPGVSSHTALLQELVRTAFFRHVEAEGVRFLERLQVSTFHSFCAQLLRLAPQAAGLPPDFGLLEEHEAGQVQKTAVERLRREISALPGDDPVRQALVQRLVRLNNSWPQLAGELQQLLARRDILGEFLTLARESRDPGAYEGVLHRHLETMILPEVRDLAREFGRAEIGRRWPELYGYLVDQGAELAATLPAEPPGAGLEDLLAWRALAQGLLTAEGRCFKRFTNKFPKEIKKTPWGELLGNLPEGLVQRLRPFQKLPTLLLQPDEVPALQDLIILLHRALGIYDGLCIQRRSLDFIGLEEKALTLLETGILPELMGRLDRRLQHLLVDEFQDTSLNQIRLLCQLLEAWQGEAGRSLMVVGDPKQSIYGWRQARVELFLLSRREQRLPCVQSPGLDVLTLETNFRSTHALIQWTNEVFGQTIMPNEETCGVQFHPAASRPDPEVGRSPHLALFLSPDREAARQWEAAWLAGELHRRQGNLSAGETIGVLLFTRRHLSSYLAAWRQAGLNVKVRDGLPLKESSTVQHLHNLATALVRPHDDVAWAGLLRGFAGNRPLGALAAVAAAPGRFWSEKLSGLAGAGGPEELEFWQALDTARQRLGREPLESILAEWLTAAGGWRKAAAWEGPQGVANGKAYLDLVAGSAASTLEDTLAAVTDRLEKAYQPPDPQAQDSPVEVLTVHGAKGLEYDYVYVPFVDWEPLKTGGGQAPFLMEEMPGSGTALIALNRAYQQEEQSVLFATLRRLARKNALGEARRLFYVAATRARKRLWLSGVGKIDASGEMKYSPDSPLGWLREHYRDEAVLPGVEQLWSEPDMAVSMFHQEPTVSEEMPIRGAGEGAQASLPAPYDIQPEPWPYEIRQPSQLTGAETKAEEEVRESSPGLSWARVRGEVSHRLLEGLSQGRDLPDPAAVAAALQGATATAAAALELARDILSEIRACQADPFLARLLDPNLPLARSEWLLEAWTEAPRAGSVGLPPEEWRTLYRGQIDRLVFDGQYYWIVDYKTSRPAAGVDWEDFISSEAETYRPQLQAYREMAARYFGVASMDDIRLVLYFTACQRHVVLGG